MESADALAVAVGAVTHDQPDGGGDEGAVRQTGADAAGDEPADRVAERVHERRQCHRDDRAADDQPFATPVGVGDDHQLGYERGNEACCSDPAELCCGDASALLQGRQQGEHHHERTRECERAGVECLCCPHGQ
jgi:hypothetical protein